MSIAYILFVFPFRCLCANIGRPIRGGLYLIEKLPIANYFLLCVLPTSADISDKLARIRKH